MALWGGSFIAIKIGLRHLTPAELVTARFVPSAMMLLPMGLLAAKRSGPPMTSFWKSLSRQELAVVIITSFLSVPAYHFCLNVGETMIPAGWAGLVISLNPACIAIYAAILLHEKVGARRWAGVALAFTGLVFIALTHEAHADDGRTLTLFQKGLGIFITLGAVISWGGSTTLSKKLIEGRKPLETLGWIMTLGALWTIPFWKPSLGAKFLVWNPELWWSVIFLSVGCTVFGFAVWYWTLSHWQASRAGAFIYLVPLFALIISRVMLGERLDLATLVGAAGVLGGVVLAGTKSALKIAEGLASQPQSDGKHDDASTRR